jgi:uncharacterized protein YdeI (YjbR/CyaY-like superfamily)
VKNVEEFCPQNKNECRDWLKSNHAKKDAVWLIFYKKKSPLFNVSWSESVDEALCFGWIDSTKKSIDSEKYIQYFSKRKAKCNWSKVNKNKIDALISEGRMKEAGYQSIEIAKENGSWTILDEVEALVIPQDLNDEFAKHQGSFEYFEGLSNSAKKILLYWVVSAKRSETRQKRILEIAENASNNTKPKQFR